jgi:DNA-binding SARP family transcriptional activator
MLLLEANQGVARDRLIEELWGGNTKPSARNSLHVRVSNLRKALGRCGLPAGALASLEGAYVLRIEPQRLDLFRFELLLARAEEAAAHHETTVASEMLKEALALWRGPALADFASEEFALVPAARLEELRLLALEMRNDIDLELGRHAELIADLGTLVAQHPFRERLRGQLMVALYRAGRQSEALAQYQAARRKLTGELGIEPGPLLQELERRVLHHDPTLDTPVPPSERTILAAPQDPRRFDALLVLAESLVRRPPRELIIARLVQSGAEVTTEAAFLNERREVLLNRGISTRTVVFTSTHAGADLVRVALEQDVDLVLVDGGPGLDDSLLETLLTTAPCDVAVHVGRDEPSPSGPILVLFGGSSHDWTAIELGAWLAGALGATLRLAGPQGAAGDASRTLASASLAVQRALGIAAEPVLLARDEAEVLAASKDARLVVIGLPDGWRVDGLGRVRGVLASTARPPALLVRRGPRPGGLAPRESLTRFTWSLGSSG